MSTTPAEPADTSSRRPGRLRALLRMPVAPGEHITVGWALSFGAQFAVWSLAFGAFFHGTAKWKPWWVFARVALLYVGLIVGCALVTAWWQRRAEQRREKPGTPTRAGGL